MANCSNLQATLVPVGMYTGFIQAILSKIQGLLKTILQFSRNKSLGKILIQVLKSTSEMLD